MATRKPHAADRSPHLDAESLAALIEGGLGQVETHAAESHLLTCRTCMAAYADAVRLNHEWTRSPGSRAADANLRELGYGLFPGGAAQGKGDGPAARPRVVRRRRAAPQRWLIAAVLPLLVVGAAWIGLQGGGGEGYAGAAAVIDAAVADASHHGMLLPGTAAAAWAPGTRYRAPGHTDADLAAALAGLAEYNREPEARFLRARGLLAAGQLDLARVLTETELRAVPGDVAWRSLAAVVAFRENDLAAAEMLLRGVLAEVPTEPEALFNLGLVVAAAGRTDEAQRVFRALAEEAPETLLNHRARAELARLGN